MTVDWTKPIETVPCERNPDPVPCEFAGMSGRTASYFIRGDWFGPQGQNQTDGPWHNVGSDFLPQLRNVETTTPTDTETPTLRDQFAMAALTGFARGKTVKLPDQMAELCYMYADAMMQARK